MGRTIFIGDVHGCLRELEDLLDACAFASSDQLILVGDLVAKGPDSPGVLGLVRRLGARGVRGNHDHAVLRWRETALHKQSSERGSHHLQVARQLSAQDWAVLLGLPLFLHVPEHAALVVHGGLLRDVPVEDQEPDLLMNMRTLRPDGSGSRRADEGELWGARWPGPERVVFGHHAMAGLQRHPFAVGIDTGCVYGGRLSAYLLPDDRVVSVPSHGVYANAVTERRSHS